MFLSYDVQTTAAQTYTVNYVLIKELTEDPLLTSLRSDDSSESPRHHFRSHSIIKLETAAQDCNLYGHRIIKMFRFNHFVCKDFIKQAKINSKLAVETQTVSL
jgi:hypothetical protein